MLNLIESVELLIPSLLMHGIMFGAWGIFVTGILEVSATLVLVMSTWKYFMSLLLFLRMIK
jgi:hypothetical protein